MHLSFDAYVTKKVYAITDVKINGQAGEVHMHARCDETQDTAGEVRC